MVPVVHPPVTVVVVTSVEFAFPLRSCPSLLRLRQRTHPRAAWNEDLPVNDKELINMQKSLSIFHIHCVHHLQTTIPRPSIIVMHFPFP